MSELPILDHISTLAEQEIARISGDAAAQAVAISNDAAAKSEEMVTKTIQAVESEADRIRERQINALRFSHNATRYELKSRALSDLWREAESRITELMQSDQYPSILAALFMESASQAPDGAVVHAAPGDTAQIEKLVTESGRSLSVVPDEGISGGVAFHWSQGGTVLINTLGRRLARLKDSGGGDISRLLFTEYEECDQ